MSLAASTATSCVRRLLRCPAFTAAVVCNLALGIGAATAVFGVLDSVILEPLRYPHADRLVRLRSAVPGIGAARWGLAKGQYLHLRSSSQTLDRIGLYRLWSATAAGAGSGCAAAHEVLTAQTSWSLASTLGMERPELGRLPLRSDEKSPVPLRAWLTHDYWQRCFAGHPSAVGREIDLDGIPTEVAGVLPPWVKLPEEVRSPRLQVEVWVPLHLDSAEPAVASHVFRAVGRLRPESPRRVAAAEIAHLTEALPTALPEAYSERFMAETGFATELVPLREDVIGDAADLLWMLFAASGLVLFVAFANAANLCLARSMSQERHAAIRAALGAGRSRLATDALAEAAMLGGISWLGGLALATGALQLLRGLAPVGIPRLAEIEVGWPAVAFSLGVALAIGAALGILLAHSGRASADLVLRQAGRVSAGRRQRRYRHGLVVGQAALCLLLLSGSLLLLRSVHNLLSVPSGIDAEGVVTFRVVLPEAGYESHVRTGEFYERLVERLTALPGVESAGLSSALPFTGFDGCSSVYTGTATSMPDEPRPCLPFFLVSPGYLETLRVPLEGASIGWDDLEARLGVAVASRAAVRTLWPDGPAVGAEFRGSSASMPYRVVGVAGDVRANGLDRPPVEALYLPLVPSTGAELWGPVRDVMAAVRVEAGAASAVAPAIRRAVTELDPRVPIASLRAMTDVLADSLARVRFLALLIGVAAAVALLLTIFGVYGLMSYLVVQQRAEIGIRLALGSDRRGIRRMVVGRSLRLAALGLTLGFAGMIPASSILRSYLFEVGAFDPAILAASALLVVIAAVAAAWRPAARAARVPPVETLRQP